MKILLLSATQQEIEPFLQQKRHIDVLIGGVGIASTTFHLTRQLLHHHYDMVIQAGVAGLFTGSNGTTPYEIAEVVTVSKDAFGDLGAYEQQYFKSISDLQLSNEFEWIYNKQTILDKLPYKKVPGITINTVTDNQDFIKALQKKWNPAVESMEGAALHFVCCEKEIPFIQLRATCNYVGERDKSKWQLTKAIDNLNKALTDTLHLINQK